MLIWLDSMITLSWFSKVFLICYFKKSNLFTFSVIFLYLPLFLPETARRLKEYIALAFPSNYDLIFICKYKQWTRKTENISILFFPQKKKSSQWNLIIVLLYIRLSFRGCCSKDQKRNVLNVLYFSPQIPHILED